MRAPHPPFRARAAASARARAGARAVAGFSLIELVVVIGILAVIAGTAMPVIGKSLTRGKIADTRAELAQLAPAIGNYFEDTGSFPPSFADLEQNLAGLGGWAGPYTKALLAAQPSTTTSLSRDAWNRNYVVTTAGASALTITSLGQDGQSGTVDDLVQSVDVTPIRRARTLLELSTVNTAITRWNASNLPTMPLPADYPALLNMLVGGGYMPAGTSAYDADGWGDAYVPDPPAATPVVAVTSIHV